MKKFRKSGVNRVMTKEEFIGKLQMCYFGDRNAFNEIVGEYDKLKAEYERIYNENCKLREQHNINDISLLDENNRLNNIIDELEKVIQENKFWIYNDVLETRENFEVIDVEYILDKLKSLKENNK